MHEALRPAGDPIDALLAGNVKSVEFGPNGQVVVDAPRTHRVILPGSFNPLHQVGCGRRKCEGCGLVSPVLPTLCPSLPPLSTGPPGNVESCG